MSLSLSTFKTIADTLPFNSCYDRIFTCCKEQDWLKSSLNVFPIFQLDQAAIQTTTQMVSRFACAYFTIPCITAMAAAYNMSIGVFYIGLGFISAFKGSTTEEDQAKINHNFHIGFIRVLTATYDYGIGYLIKKPILGFAASLLFGVAPEFILKSHTCIFEKSKISTDNLSVDAPLTCVEKNCKIDVLANALAQNIVFHLQQNHG